MSNPTKVLILSYTFPPAAGIGGRRWAKFAKYLKADHNCDIFILTNKNELTTRSEWEKDTDTYKKNIFQFDNPYPSIINKSYYSFLDKLIYRLALLNLKFRTKGNYYDKTCLLGESFLTEVRSLVTAGPFSWLALITKLKRDFPEIRFIADFRDPWTNNKTSFGYSSLPKSRLDYEKNQEKKVIQIFDNIFSVSPEMNKYFSDISKNTDKEKFACIPNGFDTEDFQSKSIPLTKGEKLRFIFAGSLYNKTEYLIIALSKALNEIKKENPELYHNMEFHFIGEMPNFFKKHFENLHNIYFKGIISLKEVHSEIEIADACMLFLTEDLGYSMSTKFYEYIAQRKPIAVFSNKGRTGKFVEENHLGYNIDNIEVIKDKIIDIYRDWKNGTLIHNNNFNISIFDVKEITKNIIPFLK